MLNGSLKCKKEYVTTGTYRIAHKGTMLLHVTQFGAMGTTLYLINSTDTLFEAIKIVDTLRNHPITITSTDKTVGEFVINWDKGIGYYVCYIRLL